MQNGERDDKIVYVGPWTTFVVLNYCHTEENISRENILAIL